MTGDPGEPRAPLQLGDRELVRGGAAPAPGEWPRRASEAQLLAVPINPTGELAEPTHVFEAMRALNEKDGFRPIEVDEQIAGVHDTQLAGHLLLIDREGIVRWTHVEAGERIADLAKFPGASRRGPPRCGTSRCS